MVPLRVLRPQWLKDPGREDPVGVELDCPRHPDQHRALLYFENPSDGGAPSPRAPRGAMCHLASLPDETELTLLPLGPAPYQPLSIGHWSGWLIEGHLTECRVVGVTW